MPTKEIKRHARGLVEALESRAHVGPPVGATEIVSAREFLRKHEFSAASDYFSRLERLQKQVGTRPSARQEKRNYGGEAAGYWMQLQSIYDHVIISSCYNGEFNSQRGRIKISHRFNQAGRIDFVELKYLRSLQPVLTGEIRKLVTVNRYQDLKKDWFEAEAFALRVLPRELIFLHPTVFRSAREYVLEWLINIGHRMAGSLLDGLRAGQVNGQDRDASDQQLALGLVTSDAVAMPILEQAAGLDAVVEMGEAEPVIVRYVRRLNGNSLIR
jgi:hypothetical protein